MSPTASRASSGSESETAPPTLSMAATAAADGERRAEEEEGGGEGAEGPFPPKETMACAPRESGPQRSSRGSGEGGAGMLAWEFPSSSSSSKRGKGKRRLERPTPPAAALPGPTSSDRSRTTEQGGAVASVPCRSALAFGKQEEVSSRKKVTSERCGGVGSWPLRRNRRRVILGGSKGREGKMKEIFFSSPPTRLLFSRVFSLTHFFQKIRRAFSSLLFLQRP